MNKKIFSYLTLILIFGIGWATTGYSQNMAPVLDLIGAKFVEEGDMLEFRVSATDPDGDSIILSAENIPDNSSFVDSCNGAGVFTFIPDHLQAGIYEVTFIASDSILADSEVVTITVNNEPWAWVWINDTTAYTGKQNSEISVLMQTEFSIGGIDLKFIVNRPDVFNFSTNHIEVIDDTIVIRVMDLDTAGCCTNNFEWLYPYGDVGDTNLPTCRYMTVAGKTQDEEPIPIGTCVLFRLVVDMFCFSDTATNRTAYIDIVGSLSDSSGYKSVPNLMNYGQLTILPSICGDVNADQEVDLIDVIYLAHYCFGVGPSPCPVEAGDISGDETIDIVDAIMIANYIILGIEAGCFAN